MAAPAALTGEVVTYDAVGAASLAVTLPSGTYSKIVFLTVNQDVTGTLAPPSGWSWMLSPVLVDTGGAFATCGVAYSDSATSSTSETFTWTGGQRSTAIAAASSDSDFANASISGVGRTIGSAPDPPNLTGLTSGDYLIVATCLSDRGDRYVTSYPETGDNLESHAGGTSGDVSVAICSTQQTSITSYNPGTFGTSSAIRALCVTIALPEDAGGGQTLSPANVSQTLTAVNPAVTTGNVDLSPANVQELLAALSPTLAVGAVAVTPDLVSQPIGSESPTLTAGPVVIDPDAVSQLLAAIDPAVVAAGSVIEPDAVLQTIAAVDPVVAVGAVTIAPSLVSSLLAAIDPTISVVGGPQTVDPSLVSQPMSAVDPAVLAGAVSITPDAVSALIAAVDPTIVVGAAIIATALESQPLAAVDPTVVAGTATIGLDAVSQALAAIDPAVVAGAVLLEPALSSLPLTAVDPALVQSGGVITVDTVEQLLAALDPLIAMQIVLLLVKTMSRFYRIVRDGVPSLYLVPAGRRITSGWRSAESFEKASDRFIHNTGEEDDIMAAMTSEWATHQDAAIATLKAAIDAQLMDIGYRGPGGVDLG